MVDITVGADKRTCLVFLGYLAAEKDIQPGLGVFTKPELSSWCESWLRALEAKELRYSTMANCVHRRYRRTPLSPLSPHAALVAPSRLRRRHEPADHGHELCVQHVRGG